MHIADEEKNLNPLSVIYQWAEEHGYKTENEHIVIEGLPVQFLLAYNELVKEALENRAEINIFNEKTYILKAEYLMAIMLQTGRLTDRERLARFFAEAEYDNELFHSIIKRFGLEDIYKKNYEGQNG